MKSYIIHLNGKITTVKNLGWLLRNWQGIEYIGFNYHPDTKEMCDGQLIAKYEDKTYFSDFASLSVFWNWVDRPVFRGLKFSLVWGKELNNKKEFEIGNKEWRDLNKLEYKDFLAQVFEKRENIS